MNSRPASIRPEDFGVRLTCPACGQAVRLPHSDGNTIAMPLVCEHCGHRFRPRYYCPDRKAPAYHVFEAERLYVDNLRSLYTFCPEHTYTTYDLVPAESSNRQPLVQLRRRLTGFLSTLIFRLALTLELARQRLFSIARRPVSPPPSTEPPGPFSTTRR